MRSRAKSVLPPSKLRERRKQLRNWRIAMYGALVLLLCAGAIGFFYIPALHVRSVTVEGTATIAPQSITDAVLASLGGKKYFVIPRRNAFVYSDASVKDTVARQFPRLDAIEVSLQNFHTVKVAVTERVPYAVFCGAAPDMPQTPCLLMDAKGVVFESAPDFSDNAYVRWYGGGAKKLGERYLSQEQFRSVSALIDAFKTEQLSPVSVWVEDSGDVRVADSSGAEVFFTLSRKPEEVLSMLRSARASEALAGKDISEIAYIDLRFGNRLYYKLR